MDLKEFFDNLKEKIISLYDRVKSFCVENKTISIVIGALIFVIIICIILLTCSVGQKKETEEIEPIVLTQPLVTPEGPVLPKDYNITRKTDKSWNETEVSEWFTVPSEKEVEALSKSNDNMVNEIIGAAP